jgi:hypothetical protein
MFLGLLNRRSKVGTRIPTPYERPLLHLIETPYKYHFFSKKQFLTGFSYIHHALETQYYCALTKT